jgi:hypothetical protein
MKVTSNLSFLLCISSVVTPVVDARANGFGLLKRSAVTKRYDFAVHQQRRSLQTDGLSAKDFCESNLKIVAPNVDCTCTEDGEPTLECDILLAECAVCDTIQGEITCLAFDQAATNTAITRHDFCGLLLLRIWPVRWHGNL